MIKTRRIRIVAARGGRWQDATPVAIGRWRSLRVLVTAWVTVTVLARRSSTGVVTASLTRWSPVDGAGPGPLLPPFAPVTRLLVMMRAGSVVAHSLLVVAGLCGLVAWTLALGDHGASGWSMGRLVLVSRLPLCAAGPWRLLACAAAFSQTLWWTSSTACVRTRLGVMIATPGWLRTPC